MTALQFWGFLGLVATVAFTVAAVSGSADLTARMEAIVEVWLGIVIGFSLNYVINMLALPMVGIRPSAVDNFWLGCIFTSVSVIRGYAIRRWAQRHISGLARAISRGITTKQL